MSKRTPKPLKIILIVLASLAVLLVAIVIAINIFVRIAFAPFYSNAQNEFDIPGIHEGFIPQDLDYLDIADKWLFSGYAADGSSSPVYWRNADNTTGKFFVTLPNGETYADHGSAVTSTDDFVYLTCEGGCYVLDAAVVANASNGEYVSALGFMDLSITPAFMNIENNTLYAGEFFLEGPYPTDESHHIITVGGELNSAIMFAFSEDARSEFGFAATPNSAYSIPDKVQGVCITSNNQMVLSTSWGLSSSRLALYNFQAFEKHGEFEVAGTFVPLMHLCSQNYVSEIEAPPMTEGIEWHNGRVYIAEESASNKYIFGKLYGAGVVWALQIS